MTEPVRTLVVCCLDWPLTALGVAPSDPAMVLASGRVAAASVTARSAGVVVGQRRRGAQARCPEAVVLERDEVIEARRFEAVVVALSNITPWVEVQHPGTCAFAVRGPVRLFGGEEALVGSTAATVQRALDDTLGTGTHPGCRIGVADGPFAAGLASRSAMGEMVVVPSGGTPAFLAPLPVSVLERPDLADVLVRLGLTTLGALAALPAQDVVARFGSEGMAAQLLASGLDSRQLHMVTQQPDMAVGMDMDPPVDRIEQVAFAARSLAGSLHDGLARQGLACTCVVVEAETGHGERLARRWRDEGAIGAGDMADRVRWQLEGWLHGPPSVRPTSGLVRLDLTPEEVVHAGSHQAGFWGGVTAADERAGRALSRVAVMLGPGSVGVPEWRGGRDPAGQFTLVPFPEGPVDGSAGGAIGPVSPPSDDPPWPGVLPPPAPAAVHPEPAVVEVVDADGHPVVVDGRGVVSAEPVRVCQGGGAGVGVISWAGPWPVDERWWDPLRRSRRVSLQVVSDDGLARLLVLEGGSWRIAATYD